MEYIHRLHTKALRELCQSGKIGTPTDDATKRNEQAIVRLRNMVFNLLGLAPILRLTTSVYECSLSNTQQQLIRDERTYFDPLCKTYHACLLACILSDEGVEAQTAKSIADQIVYNRQTVLKYYNTKMQDVVPTVEV